MDKGLSPYARGNQMQKPSEKAKERSIPVCTGKPHPARDGRSPQGVYPRMHGETPSGVSGRDGRSPQGVYPRMHGETCIYSGQAFIG